MSNRRRERSIDLRGWKSSKGANEVVGGEGGELSKRGGVGRATLLSVPFHSADAMFRIVDDSG